MAFEYSFFLVFVGEFESRDIVGGFCDLRDDCHVCRGIEKEERREVSAALRVAPPAPLPVPSTRAFMLIHSTWDLPLSSPPISQHHLASLDPCPRAAGTR